MSIIEKLFRYGQTDLLIIKYKDEIWFRGKTVAEILGYAIQRKAIREHVDPEDKRKLSELGLKSKQNETDPLKSKQNESFWLKKASGSRGSKTDPLTNNEKNTIYINESGLYSLILHSKLESVRLFKVYMKRSFRQQFYCPP